MVPEDGHVDGETNQNTVFIDTSLDTHLATIVSDSDTVSDLKKKIILEHRQCFPSIGDIEIHCLKVKRRGNYYHLSDSMLVKSACGSSKKIWFLSVDASRLEQRDGFQHLDRHRAGDQLALPWVTDSRSTDRHDSHAGGPSKLSLVHGSPSMHPKMVPFVNQKVPSVDQFTSGDSCKDVSKNIDEDRSSNDDHRRNLERDSEQQLESKVGEKLYTVNKEIKNKKRIRDMRNESLLEDALGSGPSVKKKRKTQRTVSNVKASEEDRVLTYDTDEVKHKGTSINDENPIEHKSKSKDAALDGVVTNALSDEHTGNMVVSKKMVNRINEGENYSARGRDQIATVAPSSVEDVGEETRPQENIEASEAMPDVAMVVEKNVPLEMPFGTSEKEKDNELVQKEVIGKIPSSSMRTSDCDHDAPGVTAVRHRKAAKRSTKHKAAEKEASSTPFIKKLHNTKKDAVDSSQEDLGSPGQEFAGDQIDKCKEDGVISLNQGPNVKLSERSKGTTVCESTGASKTRKSKKSTTKNKDKSLVKDAENPVGDIPLTFPSPALDEKIVDEGKDDVRNEVLVKTLVDDSLLYASKKGNDLVVKDVESSEPTESGRSRARVEDVGENASKELKDTVESRRKKTDVGRSAVRNDESVVRHSNEENLLPQCERKESLEITSIDALHVDHGRSNDNIMDNAVEISRTEKHKSQGNAEGIKNNPEKENEKMDGTKKSKKKTKIKKSAAGNENEAIAKHARMDVCGMSTVSGPALDGHLHEYAKEGESCFPNADRKVVPKEKLDYVSELGVDTDGSKPKGKDERTFDDGLVRKVKNHKSLVRGRSDLPSKHQYTEVELEPEKSKSIEHPPIEETLKNTVSEVSKAKLEGRDDVNNEVDDPKGYSFEIDFMNYFVPGHQPNKIASTDKVKDAMLSGREKKPKKKTKESQPHVETSSDPRKKIASCDYKRNREQDDSRNDSAIQSLSKNENNKVLFLKNKIPEVSNDVVKDPNISNMDQIKTHKSTKKIGTPNTSKSAHTNKGHGGPSAESSSCSETFGSRSFHNQKNNKQQSSMGQARVKTLKKSAPVVNSSQHVKSLLNNPGTIFGDDSDKSSADDNATANLGSSTRTPSGKTSSSSSSSEESPSIDSRRNESRAIKRKEGDGKSRINSLSRLKNISMADLLRSSSRFKKAKLTASQHVDDTESEPVDFVPESQPMDKR